MFTAASGGTTIDPPAGDSLPACDLVTLSSLLRVCELDLVLLDGQAPRALLYSRVHDGALFCHARLGSRLRGRFVLPPDWCALGFMHRAGEDWCHGVSLLPDMAMAALPEGSTEFMVDAGTELTLVARNKSATTSLLSVKRYATATVLKMDGKKSGACRGDSGGAVLLRRGRGWALGGILMYEGEEDCEKKQGVAFFPKGILKHL